MRLQRKPFRLFRFAPLGALIVVLSPAACGGGDPTGAEVQGTATDTALAQRTTTEGRLLASNCNQCHGTLGKGGFEEIRGKSANELLEYQRKSAARDIMAAHAQGYTREQLNKIAAYLKQ